MSQWRKPEALHPTLKPKTMRRRSEVSGRLFVA
nr:MAG TPA: hypothetical protein [Caudoviricetes sp.]